MSQCVICFDGGTSLVCVTQRGKDSLIKFAKLRKDENVLERLQSTEEIFVHESCRKNFNNKKRINAEKKNNQVTCNSIST